MNAEAKRLSEQKGKKLGDVASWDRWGPYVSERGWGTVREDYSANGDAWNYFPYDHAHLRAYRRSEDGIAGISDRYQVLLFAPAFWNGCDQLLKERLFGLNAWEGNHGEDVKEIYYHLDATPTHSYLKYLYKYPQRAFPYGQLKEENRTRGVGDREYELIDTGIFEEDRYFDIFVEYAKAGPEDLCIRIEAVNRGPEAAVLHVLPQLWFRNQWTWEGTKAPVIVAKHSKCLMADDRAMASPKHLNVNYHLRRRYLYGEKGELLFTNNETNTEALWGTPNQGRFAKDGFHRYVVHQEVGAINPEQRGTKSCFHCCELVESGQSMVVRLRLTHRAMKCPLKDIDAVIAKRKKEADAFYQSLHPKGASCEEKAIQRQAFAGMIWNKQIYLFDVGEWIQGDPLMPPPPEHRIIRNVHWRHVVSMRVLSMPDKWEYPWFAAWDLTFQALSFALIDLEFAKSQLWLLLFDQFQHPNGAIPAYEWEFSDVNPPVQAWAVLKIFQYEKRKTGREDFDFLEKCFHKLLLNFSWWINRVDRLGNNIFEGGFLGMDNISLIENSNALPAGSMLDQADGAGWISLLCLNLMRIALTLAKKNRNYEGLGIKFFEHFIFVTAAMRKGYWRHYDMFKDGFFYSFLRHPDGSVEEIPARSLVGIIPFFACDVWREQELKSFPHFYTAYQWILQKRSNLAEKCIQPVSGGQLFGLLSVEELKQFLRYIWDPEEFRSDFGLRSLSKYHEKHPVRMHDLSLAYEPGEAKEKIKGGNSNWRGPIWFPLNFLFIDTLLRLGDLFGNRVTIEGNTLTQMAHGFSENLLSLFKRNREGKRPLYGESALLQNNPHFKDYFLFYEHFHGETGRGLGASHQTGWTGLIANLIDVIRGMEWKKR